MADSGKRGPLISLGVTRCSGMTFPFEPEVGELR